MKLKYLLLLPAFIFGFLSNAQTGNNALNFDGIDDHVVVSPTIPYTSTFTLEAWVNFSGTSATIFGWGNNTVNGYVDFSILNGRIRLAVGNEATFSIAQFDGSTVLSSNTWYHVGAVKNGSSITLYLNGSPDGTFITTNVPAPVTSSIIGAGLFNGTVQGFNSKSIDELRVWNVARTPSEISANRNCNINPQTGLVSLYRFNQGVAGSANPGITSLTDNSGNFRTGTLNNFSLVGSTSNWVNSPVIPATGNYRSVGSGSFNSLSTWEVQVGDCWEPATEFPTVTSNNIFVRAGHTVTINSAVNADQIIIDPSGILAINSGGTLSLSDGPASDLVVNGTLNLNNNGILNGSGTVLVNSSAIFNWSAGTIGGSVSTDISTSATLNITGIGGTATLNNSATIINSGGTINWTGAGNINCSAAGSNVSISNGGLFLMNSTANFTNTSGGIFFITNSSSGSILRNVAGNTTITANVGFVNQGSFTNALSTSTITIQSTDFNLANGSSLANDGTINFTAGSDADITGFTDISGNGNININGGVVRVANSTSVSGLQTITLLNAGVIEGSGIFQLNSGTTLNWTSGILRGSGTLRIVAGSILNINGGGDSSILQDNRIIDNSGTINWSTTGNIIYNLASTNATINNSGNFNITASAGFSNQASGAQLTLNNNVGGTITKTNGNTTLDANVSFNNSGTTNVNSGTLTLNNTSGSHAGTYFVANGAAISGSHNINFTGATFTNFGNITNNALTFSGTTASQSLNGSGSISFLTINNNFGITLGGNQTVNSILIFNNGNINTGSNKVIVASTGTVQNFSGTDWYVNGNLQLNYGVGSISQLFRVGDGLNYRPVLVTVFNSLGNGGVTVSTINGDNPNIAGSGLNPLKSVNRYWSVEVAVGNTDVQTTFNWDASDLDPGVNVSTLLAREFNGSNWSLGTVTLQTASSARVRTVSNGVNFYQIGELASSPVGAPFRTISSGDWFNNTIWEYFDGSNWVASPVSPDQSSGQISIETGHNVEVNFNTLNIDDLTIQFGGSLTTSFATLQYEISEFRPFIQVNGTLNAANTVINGFDAPTGVLNITGDGQMNVNFVDANNLQIENNGTITCGGSETFRISNTSLNNLGILNVSSNLAVIGSGSITNNNLILINANIEVSSVAGGFINNTNDGDIRIEANPIISAEIQNDGEIIVVSGNQLIHNAPAFALGGSIIVESGAEISSSTSIQMNSNIILNDGEINANPLFFTGDITNLSGTGSLRSVQLTNNTRINLGSNHTITETLDFIGGGRIVTGSNTLTIAENATILGNTDQNYVQGNLQRYIAASLPVMFPVGDASNAATVTITPSVDSPGFVTVSTTGGEYSEFGTSGLDPNSSVNRFWTISNQSLIFSVADVDFTWNAADVDPGASQNNFIAARYNGSSWSLPSTTLAQDGQLTASNILEFGDFVIASTQVGQAGASLNFDGNNDEVQWGGNLVPNNNRPYSLSIWVKANGSANNRTILSQGNNLWLAVNNFGDIQVADNWVTGAQFPNDNNWHNLIIVRNEQTASLYLDGAFVSQNDFPLGNPDGNFVLGTSPNTDQFWSGNMDELRVWDKLLCSQEIQDLYNCSQVSGYSGLLSYYNFNQGTNNANNSTESTLIDNSGNNINAFLFNFDLFGPSSNYTADAFPTTGNCPGVETFLYYRDADGDGFGNASNSMWLNNACGLFPGYVLDNDDCNDNDPFINPNNLEVCNGADDNCDGQIDNNNALNFDGIDDYVEIPEPALGSGEFTIEFWINPDVIPTAQEMYLVTNRTTEGFNAGNWYRISMLPGGFIEVELGLADQPFGVFFPSSSSLVAGQWSHIAFTRSSDNTIKLYINGILENTAQDVSRNFVSLNGKAYLGMWQNLGIVPFDGSMDELRFWTVARTQNELRLNKIANLGNEPNLIRNYTFNQGTSNGENGPVFTLIDAVGGTNGFLDFFALSSDFSGSNWTNGFSGLVYADVDNDGFGDPNNSQAISSACNIPAGFVSDFSDCNDLNGDINPNGAEILNGVDDNCDGQTDEGFSNCNISLTSTTGNQVIICTESGATTANVQLVVNNGLPPYNFGAQDSLNLTVGVYTFTVSDEAGCEASANIEVVQANCIVPYYQPPANDTISNLIGAELTQLFFFPETFADTTVADNIFEIKQLQGEVLIEVISNEGQYDALLALLQTAEYGINNLIDNGDSTLIITGFYPISNLKKLDSLPDLINYVRPYYAPIASSFANTGLTVTQGDKAMGADNAKNGWNVSGNGVKIGVLSDSYNTKAGDPAQLDVENGDLPGVDNPNFTNPVNVLFDYPFGRASDEGRAMLQIIHDVAPNAELYFRSGFISAGNMAEGIKELQAAGCDVIVDDITYITEPYFLDGVVAQAVEEVAASGISYVTSAGNFGVKSYEGIFNATTAPNGYAGVAHDFGGGDVYQSISFEPGTFTIALQWEDGFYSLGQTTGTRNDLDIYLVDQFGNRLFGFNRNNLDGDPLEILPFVVRADVNANLIVTRKGGNDAVKFKYIIFRGSATINEFNQGSATIMGQANAESAMTIGAVLYTNTPAFGVEQPTVASFSSRGGLEINGVDRQKPDFCGPNGVNTTVNLGGVNLENDLFPNFFGTSAAAPHVAAATALILEAKQTFQNETLNGAQIKALIKNNLTDMGGDDDYDPATGNGYLEVDKVLASFSNPQPIAESLEITNPTAVVGEEPIDVMVKGQFFDENASIVFQYDTLDAQFMNDSTLIVQIPSFVGNPPLTVLNPALTNSGLDGGVSDSLYFFGTIPQNVVVKVNNAVKRFGEQIPAYAVEVSVDGTPLDSTGLSMDDLGLGDLTFTSSANAFSNVGLYFRRANSSVTDLSLPESQALAEFYNYQFIDGVLTIERMPITVTPKDTTLEYGESIDGKAIQFQYDFITENIDPSSLTAFIDSLKATHQSTMSSTVIVAEGKTLADGRSLTAADLENLSFFASGQVEANALSTGSGRRIVNGVEFDTTQYVSLAPEAIFDLQTDEVNLTIYNALSAGSGRRIVNALATGSGRRIVNALAAGSGRRIVNGETFVNGTPIVNGLSTGSGRRIVNSNTFNENSNEGAILLLDSLDTVNDGVSPDSVSGYTSMNLITGVSVGEWVIAPGALISENFDISYGLGTLNITPMQLYVRAEDKVKGCTDSTIEFTSVKEFYQYEFVDSTVVASGPDFTILNQLGEVVSMDNLSPGTYQIIPSNLVQLDSIPNYIPVYEPGQLIVESGVTAQATAGTITCFGGTTTVEVTASGGTEPYTGTGTFTVSAGAYNFTVTDAIGCVSSVSGTISQPNALPAQPTDLACWQTATFNEATCSWDVTGEQPVAPNHLACWQSASFDTVSCGWVILGTQPVQPTNLACWETASFDTVSCGWVISGTQPVQPINLACWETASFDTVSCGWVITGTQPVQPSNLACWQSASFDAVSCGWVISGTQPVQPTNLACWETASFDTVSCGWIITGTQPIQPTNLACWQSASFDTVNCGWVITGTQPIQPTNLACWETASFDTVSCGWVISGTQPVQPINLACWETASFDTVSCGWVISGTQPVQPINLACWETASFDTVSCGWVISGTQPVQPINLACWETASFDTVSCGWVITGTQPIQPTNLACWQSANFNTTSCSWDVTGTQPAQPTNLACWQTANFNTTSCSWVVTGTQPAQPTNLACWQTATFNNSTCAWDVTGTPAPAIVTNVTVCSPFTWSINNQVYSISGTYSFTINCQEYRLNLVVTPPVSVTGNIAGPTNACQHIGTAGTTATYTVQASNASSFVWTIPSGSTNVTGQGTATISFKFPSTFTSGTIGVTVGGCGTSIQRSISVTRTAPTTPLAISGPTNLCAFRGTNTQVNYSIASVANASSYTWTIPSGITLVSGTGTTSIQVLVGSSFCGGTLKVRANSACGNSSTRELALSASAPSTPASIAGASQACPGEVIVYSVASVSNATSYLWSIPSGTTIVSGSGTNTISLSFSNSFNSGTLSVRAVNGCGQSSTSCLSLQRNVPAIPASISGPANNLCGGGSFSYTVSPVAGATSYIWTVPSGCSITSNNGTTITVSFPSNFNSGSITVRAVNSCGTGTARSLSLSRLPSTPASISGPTTFCRNQQNVIYTTPLVQGLTYTWTVPNGATITSGQGTASITVKFGTKNGNVTVRASNSCGTSSTRSLSVCAVSCRMGQDVPDGSEPIELVDETEPIVYPNPGNGQFNISGIKQSSLIQVFTTTGQLVRSVVVQSEVETLQINLDNEANGLYLIRIEHAEGQRELRYIKQ